MYERLSLLTAADFEQHVNTAFRVYYEEDAAIDLTLIEVSEYAAPALNAPAHPEHRPPFSLIFVSEGSIMLNQAMFKFVHDDMGELAMFIVPIQQIGLQRTYQAIFN